MPLNFSAAHSSRIKKKSQHQPPLLRRSASSPFTDYGRRKPVQRSKSKTEGIDDEDEFFEDRLSDVGIVKTLATDLNLRDVGQTIQYIHSHMFDALPGSGGFNSTRIAEILNFRKSLPPIVTVAHIHALIPSLSATEREIAELINGGILRKLVTPGRGTGGSSVAESLILTKDLRRILGEAQGLNEDLKDLFIRYLGLHSKAPGPSPIQLLPAEVAALMRAGFLTSTTQCLNSNFFTNADPESRRTMISIASIAKAASGSAAAVGGEDAIHEAGGRGGVRRSSSHSNSRVDQHDQQQYYSREEFQLALPGTGLYLKLLTAARSHLIAMMEKSRFREMPLYLLKERWDGGISADDPAAKAKNYRGESSGVLPSRTRKWKQFYGLSFEWVIAECLGGGLVDVFETGSVGRAVRIA